MVRYWKLVFKWYRGISYFFNPHRWFLAIQKPRKAFQTITCILRHPRMYMITRNVEGLIGPPVGVRLYETTLKAKHHLSDVVEVGAFKGLSTVYLALAARQIGKRVKSFEIFSGLPTADPVLDAIFQIGEFSSSVDEYEANLKARGVRDVVDLTIGDARQTMLPALKDKGFSIAYLDVDVYDVMRELLFQLQSIARGGEVIIVHDFQCPGVRKAVMEFHALTNNIVKETEPIEDTAKLEFPPTICTK